MNNVRLHTMSLNIHVGAVAGVGNSCECALKAGKLNGQNLHHSILFGGTL